MLAIVKSKKIHPINLHPTKKTKSGIVTEQVHSVSHLFCVEFSFPRFLNGFGSPLNVTVDSLDFGSIATNNMSRGVLVPRGK